jgi:hypothetical protein
MLAIYPNGMAIYRSANGKSVSMTVPRESFAQLRTMLKNRDLARDLQMLTEQSRQHFDHEQWWFEIDGQESQLTCREVAPTPLVVQLIEVARGIAARRSRDRWFLSEPLVPRIAG